MIIIWFLLNIPCILSQPYSLLIEAEDFITKSSGVLKTDLNDGSGGIAVSMQPQSETTYTVSLPIPGKWYVWIRMTDGTEKIGMTMDGANANPVAVDLGPITPPPNSVLIAAGETPWFCCTSEKLANSFEVSNAGETTFRLIAYDADSIIDQIILRSFDSSVSPGTPTFSVLGGQNNAFCRLKTATDDDNSCWDQVADSNQNDCQRMCETNSTCLAYEWGSQNSRCELWTCTPWSTNTVGKDGQDPEAALGFVCMIKEMGAQASNGPVILSTLNEILLIDGVSGTTIKSVDLNQQSTLYISDLPNKIDFRYIFSGPVSSVGFISNNRIPEDKIANVVPEKTYTLPPDIIFGFTYTMNFQMARNTNGWEPFIDSYKIKATSWSKSSQSGLRGKVHTLELLVGLSPSSKPAITNPGSGSPVVQKKTVNDQAWLLPFVGVVMGISCICAIVSQYLFVSQKKKTADLAEKLPQGAIV